MRFITFEEMKTMKEKEHSDVEKIRYFIAELDVEMLLKLAVLDIARGENGICIITNSPEEITESCNLGYENFDSTINNDSLVGVWTKMGLFVCFYVLGVNSDFNDEVNELSQNLKKFWEDYPFPALYRNALPFYRIATKVWQNLLLPLSQLSLEMDVADEKTLGVVEKRLLLAMRSNLSFDAKLSMAQTIIQDAINSEATFFKQLSGLL